MARGLVNDFEARFFNDRVGENFLRDALDLFFRFIAGQSIDVEYEEFSLANVFDGREAEPAECVLNGLTLRIEYGALWHHPNVCFHGLSITLQTTGQRVGWSLQVDMCAENRTGLQILRFPERQLFGARKKSVFEARIDELSEFGFA